MTKGKQCGFCNIIREIVRTAMCIGNRRRSSDSYYRELGDQDTLKIEGSLASDDSVEIREEVTFSTNVNVHEPRGRHVDDSADDHGRASTSGVRPHRLMSSEPQDLGEPSQVTNPIIHHEADAVAVAEAVAVDVAVVIPGDTEAAAAGLEVERFSDMPLIRPTGRFLSLHKRRKKRLITNSLTNYEALLDDIMTGQVQCILDQSATWRFNAFTLDNVAGGRGLPMLCIFLFHKYDLISYFRLDLAKVWKLFNLFEENYHSTNPYHNSIHAADVTQAMHCFLQQDQVLRHMQPIEVMAGLLAAIAHDLDHPGVNQTFLVSTSNHLVTLYESKSVLENHHWRSAISCLIESQFFDEVPQYRQLLEEKIRSLILATDITRQQDYLGQFKIYLDTNTLDLTLAEHRHLVLQIALKCADISNPCRPWDISHAWSMKVCEEFFRQGDVERQLNLPPTPLCDRHTTTVPKIQAGFYKYVVTPLITEWHRFLQSDLSEQMLNNLIKNHQNWESFSKDEGEASGTEASGDMGENEQDSSAELSDSSEMLLPPPRRGSLNPEPVSPVGFREQLRRFSVPLNVFLDARPRKEVTPDVTEHLDSSTTGSERSLQDDNGTDLLSAEKMVPESSIASITTPLQASRIGNIFREERSWQVTRHPTFPPFELMPRAHSLVTRASSNDECVCPRAVKSDSGIRCNVHEAPRQDGALKAGTRLRENLTAWHLEFSRRRKSVPAEAMTARERRLRELREVLPALLARTRLPHEPVARRGSAPASASEPRTGYGSPRHGSSRAPRACLPAARAALDSLPTAPRRSSLPVEVMTGISSC